MEGGAVRPGSNRQAFFAARSSCGTSSGNSPSTTTFPCASRRTITSANSGPSAASASSESASSARSFFASAARTPFFFLDRLALLLAAQAALGLDHALQSALGFTEEARQAATFEAQPVGMGQHRSIFGEAGLVVIMPEHELDHRGHRCAVLHGKAAFRRSVRRNPRALRARRARSHRHG